MRLLLMLILFLPVLAAAHSVTSEHPATPPASTPSNTPSHGAETRAVDDLVSIIKGDVTSIPVLANDTSGPLAAVELTVRITGHPVEGVVTVHPETNEVTYRHGGASAEDDRFTYVIEHKGTAVSDSATVTVSFREIMAEVKIISPKDNAVISGNSVVIRYEVIGTDFDHLHVNLDGNHNTVHDPDGTYVFEKVSPGQHVISVNLANKLHQVLRVAGAKDAITVTVVDD